ncbi:Do family serine endopeptidase [Chelativorans sp. ZYF759]|uniref:DegQ family serine endoprotease n=1 Tax=Chelativorans sp. ZYF759 TaxID=2692213 RepID=UPI00145E9317|nr:DegQ family serine endoprotease [Chelativorans sp. ZYF759]NMG41355.1 Do family serine endopeptidase [Chelativorans sp. ZYF759]
MTSNATSRRVGWALAALAALALGAPGLSPGPALAQAQPQVTQGPSSVADLAEGLLDAVVNISTSQSRGGGGGSRSAPTPPQLPEGSPFQDFFEEFFRDRGEGGQAPGRPMQSLGSGFVLDAEQGIVITNNHVIADADAIEVNFSDGSSLPAELVGADPQTDLAVLRVDPSARPLSDVDFGDSDAIRIGDWVMAIGNPFGLGGSVTIGIVSARGRDIRSGPYDDFIQTDAAINRGNSGGPLFDMDGQVIGINTAIISPTGGSIGIGFAIPSALAMTVIDQLVEFGETRRGWLGVRIQPVTEDIAESLGLETANGALVAGIVQGGPADNGLIQAGDVIISFNGRAIRQMRDLPRIVAESPVGQTVDVVLVRNGEEETVQITLGRLEDADAASLDVPEGEEPDVAPSPDAVDTASILGMTVAELSEDLRSSFDIGADVRGVIITEIEEGSAAEERGIQPGEVITEIAQEAVSTPEDVTRRIAALRNQGRRNALLMLSNGSGELRFVTLRME